MERWAWVSLVVLAGCFSDPSGEDGDGSTSASSTSGQASSSGPGVSISGSAVTTSSVDDSSTGVGVSTFVDPSSSSTSTSTGEPPDTTSTGPDSMCPPGTVEVGSLCLAPLSVTDAFTVSAPDELTPVSEMCIVAECPGALSLGGGFTLDNARAFASHVDPDVASWRTCGAADMGGGSWQAHARCAVAGGDVFVATETYDVDELAGPSCYDVTCPEGTTLVGGGGRWGPNFRFQGSEPIGTGERWQVCGSGGDGDSTVEVDAHCAVLPAGTEIEVFEEIVPVDPGEEGCVLAACESGRAIAGGASVGITTAVLASRPESGDAQGWTACGRVDGIFTVEVRSRVMCIQG